MRRDCSILAVVALGLLLQPGCQQQAKKPETSEVQIVPKAPATVPQVRQPEPKIKFDKLVHNFGEVAGQKKFAAEFKITNAGDGLLKITEVKRCCGTVAKLDKKELTPGETGVLKVEYTSARDAGTMRRQIHVSSNDKTNPKVALTIRSRIVPKVAFEPKRLNFVINKENAGCPDITLRSLDNQPFSIRAFQSTGGSITADIAPSVEAKKFVLRPRVDLEKLKTRSAGFVSFGLTHPECNRIDIYFSTLRRFQITPRSVMLFNPEPQQPTVKKVTVASNYGEDFEIESTSSKNGLAKVLSWQKTAKGYQLQVEVTPPPPDDTGKATDVLYVQLKDDEKLPIKCYVRYVDKGEK
ncbi:MAG: DUF1573 domain-containing protein [Planctomycetota bacterium]